MNIVQNKNRDGKTEKPQWVDNLIEQLAEIHPALPAYFCTGKDRDVLVPIFYEGKAEQEAWMEKNRFIRLIPDGYMNNGVRDLLCSIADCSDELPASSQDGFLGSPLRLRSSTRACSTGFTSGRPDPRGLVFAYVM